jgi:hypothetical protein
LGIVTLTKLPAFALPAKKLFGIEVTFVDWLVSVRPELVTSKIMPPIVAVKPPV